MGKNRNNIPAALSSAITNNAAAQAEVENLSQSQVNALDITLVDAAKEAAEKGGVSKATEDRINLIGRGMRAPITATALIRRAECAAKRSEAAAVRSETAADRAEAAAKRAEASANVALVMLSTPRQPQVIDIAPGQQNQAMLTASVRLPTAAEEKQIAGAGMGAIGGAAIAGALALGPIGLLAGGLMGAAFGSSMFD